MAYADFTLDKVQEDFGLSAAPRSLFGRDVSVFSEKSRGEFIVAPILLTCRDLVKRSFSIYSGVRLDADAKRGLIGECDFILAPKPPIPVVQAPLMVIMEAKKNDIEEGLGQCAAQLVGARIFNERHQESVNPLYGCVTTGETWQFLQLDGACLYVDTDRYFLVEVDKILGILTAIMAARLPVAA